MALTGLQYYESLIGLDVNSNACYFDFNPQNYSISGSAIFIHSPEWCPLATGQVLGSGSIQGFSGVGNFANNYIRLNNYGMPRNFQNWSVITVVDFTSITGSGSLNWNEITTNWDDWLVLWGLNNSSFTTGNLISPYSKILFSCFPSGQTGSGAANSGYFCAINGANKLIFSHYNTVDGPQTYTYSGFIPSKSIIGVSKQGNNLNLGIYNPNRAGFDFQQFGIYNGNIVINNDWYIGGAPAAPIQYPNLTNFGGQMDEFLLLSGDAYQGFLDVLPIGFWNCPTGFTSGTYVLTGQFDYISGIFSGFSGITGYQNILQGTVTDNCGNVESIFINTPITGSITGISYISGTQITLTTGVTGIAVGFQQDLPFYNSLGMEGITIFYEILSGNDVLEYFANSVNNLGYAQENNYNRDVQFGTSTNNWTMPIVYDTKTAPVFRNGQLQLESGYLAYPSGYGSGYILSGDYFLNQREIESTGVYTVNDLILYDYNPSISGSGWLGYFGTTSGTNLYWNNIFINWNDLIINWNDLNVFVSGFYPFSGNSYMDYFYVNGQKLTTGVNIGPSGELLLPVTGQNVYQFIRISGLNSFTPTFNQVIFDTGSINTPKFLKDTSIVFYNGIRQCLEGDYVERGIFDKLTGAYFSPDQVEVLYNNTRDFFGI